MKSITSKHQLRLFINELLKLKPYTPKRFSGACYDAILDIPVLIEGTTKYLLYRIAKTDEGLILKSEVRTTPDVSRYLVLSPEKEEIQEFVKNYIKENNVFIDYQSIFQELNDKVSEYYYTHPPLKFERYLHRIIHMRREPVSTLAIGYDTIRKRYEMLYNPEYCILSTISYFLCPIVDSSNVERNYYQEIPDDNDIVSPLLLLLTHEFYHVLYNHVSTNSLYDLSPREIQLYGDAYINNIIPYMPYRETLSGVRRYPEVPKYFTCTTANHPLGITRGIGFGDFNKYINVNSLNIEIHRVMSSYIDIVGTDYCELEGIVQTTKEDKEFLLILTGNLFNIIATQYKSMIASSTYINLCKELESLVMSDRGESEDDGGDREQEGTPENPQEGELPSISGISLSQQIDDSQETDQDKTIKVAILKSIIENALKDEKYDNSVYHDGESDDTEGILNMIKQTQDYKNLGVDIESLSSNVNKSTWKALFREKIKNASGYDFIRTNSLPSRKVEGLWGSRKKTPALRHVVIMLDCSGSMGSPEFKAIFSELKGFINYPEFKDAIIHLITWGSEANYNRYRGLSQSTIKQMYKVGQDSLGGTYPVVAYELLMEKVSHPDLIIFLSDCQFTGKVISSNTDSKLVSYIKKVAKKSVYVSVDKSSSEELEDIDPMYQKRLVELTPEQARD